MNKEWKKCVGGMLTILLGFGAADRCLGNSEETAGGSRTAIGTSQVSDEEDFGEDTEGFERSLGNALSEVDEKLSAAIKAMDSLRVRVFDSHNHAVQIELLKLIQAASGRGNGAAAMLIILEGLFKDTTQKKLLLRAIASAMGGAKWISRHVFSDPVALSTGAIRAFLKLSKRESLLNHEDCAQILRQLRNNKVFVNAQSPFWAAVQSLSIAEREQLGDCFGDLPRSVYEKSREYINLQKKKDELSRKRDYCLRQNPTLGKLKADFECLGHNTLGHNTLCDNGFDVSTSFDAIHSQEMQSNLRGAVAARDRIEEFMTAWQKFQDNPNDPSLSDEQRTLCRVIQEAQRLTTDGGDTINSLKQKGRDMEREFPSGCPYLTNLTSRTPFPPKEIALRRVLMVGKPGATIRECWNVIIFQDRRFRELGTYERWTKYISDHHKLAQDLWIRLQTLDNQQDFSCFLNEATDLANQCDRFCDFFQKEITADSFFTDKEVTFHQLGGMPDECTPCYNVNARQAQNLESILNTMTQTLLKKINHRLYSSQEPPKNVKPRQNIESHLANHPDMDPTQKEQIEEILRIAAKLKIEG
jgi:hypothetical protein